MSDDAERGHGFSVETAALQNGVIGQIFKQYETELAHWLMDTREEQTRKALITLGWTPPPDKPVDNPDSASKVPAMPDERTSTSESPKCPKCGNNLAPGAPEDEGRKLAYWCFKCDVRSVLPTSLAKY